MNLLFICSRNQWRSPTGEALFKNSQLHQARSAGTEASARVRVSATMLHWADIVFVMERKHKQRLQEKFAEDISDKQVVVLDIPDDYPFMDAELVAMLQASVAPYL